MYNTVKNIWLDITPKVQAVISLNDNIQIEQENELNADINIENENGNENVVGDADITLNGEGEGEGENDEWEDLNEDADADAEEVEDVADFIESRTGLFNYPLLTCSPPQLFFSPLFFSTLHFSSLYLHSELYSLLAPQLSSFSFPLSSSVLSFSRIIS